MRDRIKIVLVIIVCLGIGFGGYWIGVQQGKKSVPSPTPALPSLQQITGTIGSYKDGLLQVVDPQTNTMTQFKIDDTSVIRLADNTGKYQKSDASSALVKDSVALVKQSGKVNYVDVISAAALSAK